MWPACVLILASQAWAMGLGDIRLSSALNEPLRAEIELLTPTQDELRNLKIRLASAETFERYGLDRPVELMGLEFLVSSGPDGSVVRVTSAEPITEPFITFLVEAEWTRGRLLREYTLLLDPPTFAPAPVAQTTQPVAAPARSQPADSGAIARPPAQSRPAPQPPVTTPEPTPQPPVTTPRQDAPPQQETPPPAAPAPTFDTSGGGQYVVQRGDTLWQIADRFRPDNRLTMNQTMLGIFEANPEAFEGNINRLSSGATLRIPSADEIFRISRGEANREALRQNEVWASGTVTEDSRPSLTLIPPDEEPEDIVAVDEPPAEVEVPVDETTADAVPSDEQRIYEIEQLLLDHQDSIIEIDDDELAVLRAELARLRGEEYVPPAEVEAPDEADALPIEEEPVALEEEPVTEPEPEPAPPPQVTPVADQDSPGFFGSILASISGFWGILLGGLILALGTLLFFARRAAQQPDDDSTGVWNALDADEVDSESAAATQRLRALAQKDDSAIVVVEVDSKPPEEDADYDPSDTAAASSVELEPFTTETVAQPADELGADPSSFDTLEAPAASTDATVAPVDDSLEEMLDGQTEPVAEHTYSSDTAINFDQSDPIAEADFHMAYGLYDQAADLVNGALALEPNRQDLLGKLCEIYFVWGNRDAFIDAAGRLRGTIGEGESNPDWDRIVIMGQQIAGDNEMFSGVSAGAATKAVDLSLEGETDDAGVLDMDFAGGGPDGVVSDVIDLGDDDGGDESTVVAEDSMIDFVFDDDDLAVSATREMPGAMQADDTFDSPLDDLMAPESTAETPAVEQPSPDATLETPSMDDQFDSLDATGELASLTNIIGDNDATANPQDMIPPDATAEIELDDLGLDLGGLSDSELDQMAGDDDLDEFGETEVAPDLTGRSDFDHFAETAETPTLSEDLLGDDLDATAETPTISEEIVNDEFAATAETPTLSEDLGDTTETPTVSQEGPEVFAETAETPQFAGDEEVTGKNFALDEELVETGKNPEVDVSDLGDAAISTGVHGVPDFGASIDATGENAALELPDAHAGTGDGHRCKPARCNRPDPDSERRDGGRGGTQGQRSSGGR
jgi:pilus assembly protein FimV